ncbi:response regulator [bacterium]|nr:response regulator [bacterium]
MVHSKGKILWADDEIEHLKPHILFLEEKGYAISAVTNAEDALALLGEKPFDLFLLDEMMPGMGGLEVLEHIRSRFPALPVIMITKSEQEDIMEEAIGSNIHDYLTKPVNPSQILSSCKKILEKARINRDRLTREYTAEFSEISRLLCGDLTASDWADIHIRLSERELKLDEHPEHGLRNTLVSQRSECNKEFGNFIEDSYGDWLERGDGPVLSPHVFRRFIVPLLEKGRRVLLVVIDNLRYDQWLAIEPLLYESFAITRDYYYSILPTATPYSRNALFAGLMPLEIQRRYPDRWESGEGDDFSRNRYEDILMRDHLERLKLNGDVTSKYIKVLNAEEAGRLAGNSSEYLTARLTALVFNFVDILAHRRSESEILREIVPDEPAYRSLTASWFLHSPLLKIITEAGAAGATVVVTSDHGSVRVRKASTVHADKEASSSLRFKYGKNINAEKRYVFNIKNPEAYMLPASGINTNYIIAKEDAYFVYPTNYHHFLQLYRDSLQHGGISLEEMILPVCTLEPAGGSG